MTKQTKIIAQLRVLVQLTQAEAQIAQLRVGQASTDAVRREFAQNADNAVERSNVLLRALRELGGVPDVVTPAVGRLTGLVKTALEQSEPLDEALLQDLALEHQLLDRARHVKVLATTEQLPGLVKLAERLITAHTATVEWLTVVLAEEALGGPAALQATPLQRVAGGATRAVNLPVRVAAETVNRTIEGVQQRTRQARAKLGSAVDKAGDVTEAARESLTAGRNAGLERAEKIARQDGERTTAKAVHASRRNLGALTATELPVKDYDQLSTADAVLAVKAVKQVADVRAVLAYEQANAGRSSVISAAEAQVSTIAKQIAGIS